LKNIMTLRLKCKLLCMLVLAVLAFLVPMSSRAERIPNSTTPDVFDALQQNVWYMQTADKKAQIYVTSLGQGPMVVVLNGGPGNDFNYIVDAVRGHAGKYRFILFDQRGSVLSPVPPAAVRNLSITTLVADLETLRQALGQKKLVLFGHSFGTLLALEYAKAHPEHVAGLVLAASFPPATLPNETLSSFIAQVRRRDRSLEARPQVKAEMVAAANIRGSRSKVGNAAIDFYHIDRWRQFQGAGVYYNEHVDDSIGNSIAPHLEFLSALESHHIPVTIIQGDHDYLDPSASRWSAVKRRAPLVRVDVCTKCLPLYLGGRCKRVFNGPKRGLVAGVPRNRTIVPFEGTVECA